MHGNSLMRLGVRQGRHRQKKNEDFQRSPHSFIIIPLINFSDREIFRMLALEILEVQFDFTHILFDVT